VQRYHIRDVCRILKVKKHIVRYWEQEVPFLAPQRDLSRSRVYTLHDLNMLFRLKYLVYSKRVPLHDAAEMLWNEVTAEDQKLRAQIHDVRAKLLLLHTRSWRLKERLEEIL